ncbi:MAG TPA: sugar ABC transporter ATP-binding protein [Nordella sp.]|nr:sugar ABC transporter ATP-binding protein [Nordella sp.]
MGGRSQAGQALGAGETRAAAGAGGSATPILSLRGVGKSFPGVVALADVDLDVAPGEVLGLVGENGAGKSTLIKILSGAHHADQGDICIAGETIDRPTPLQMIERGVAVIYQETMLAPHLSVGENMWLGRLPKTRLGLVDWARTWRASREVLTRLGFNLDPKAVTGTLSVAQRQMTEIAGALSRQARLVVLDEPSAVLGAAELEKLFEIIRRLAREGVGFIYISHRLAEVFEICDRVTVLRDGRVVGGGKTSELDSQDLISLMVGRKIEDIYPERRRKLGPVALAAEGLTRGLALRNVGIEVRAGEILGICGLAGSGRSELLRGLVGADRVAASSFTLLGAKGPASPKQAIARGLSLLPEDRKSEGCFLPQDVAFNISISGLARIRRNGVLSRRQEEQSAKTLIERLRIRTQGPAEKISQLSGGNQQKCLIARSLHAKCRVLLIDEPTRGVDVGAKREIYQLMAKLADEEDVAIVMVSSELPEILGLSDRILVMREGQVAGRCDRAYANEEVLMRAALGLGQRRDEGAAA